MRHDNPLTQREKLPGREGDSDATARGGHWRKVGERRWKRGGKGAGGVRSRWDGDSWGKGHPRAAARSQPRPLLAPFTCRSPWAPYLFPLGRPSAFSSKASSSPAGPSRAAAAIFPGEAPGRKGPAAAATSQQPLIPLENTPPHLLNNHCCHWAAGLSQPIRRSAQSTLARSQSALWNPGRREGGSAARQVRMRKGRPRATAGTPHCVDCACVGGERGNTPRVWRPLLGERWLGAGMEGEGVMRQCGEVSGLVACLVLRGAGFVVCLSCHGCTFSGATRCSFFLKREWICWWICGCSSERGK